MSEDDIINQDHPSLSPHVSPDKYLVSHGSTHEGAASLNVLKVNHSSRSVGLDATGKRLCWSRVMLMVDIMTMTDLRR